MSCKPIKGKDCFGDSQLMIMIKKMLV